jgi:hypothetical protein
MMAVFFGLLPMVVLTAGLPPEIGVGESLPELRGEFLTGQPAVRPQEAQGRAALLILGFTYRSRLAVEAWAARFRMEFPSDPRLTFFEMPMIGGPARLARWFIDSGMRRGTPKADYEHVITVYVDTKAWKHRVRYTDPDAAYLILLDRKSKVAWLYRGAFGDAASQALCSKVSELMSGK